MLSSVYIQAYKLIAFLQTGGIVMIPLLCINLLMWMLIIHKGLLVHRLGRNPLKAAEAWQYVKNNHTPDPQKHHCGVAMLVHRFQLKRCGDSALDKNIIDEITLSINRSLSGSISFIGVLAGVAPLIGLLGTVTGMMATFDVLSQFGTGNVKAMAGGISEALITTETGLVVAIPGLYLHSFLSRRVKNIQHQVTITGSFLKRHLS